MIPTRRPPPPPRPPIAPRPEAVTDQPVVLTTVRRPPPPPGRPVVAAVRPAAVSPARPLSGLSALKQASKPAPEPEADAAFERSEPAMRAEPPAEGNAPVNFATIEDMREAAPRVEAYVNDAIGRSAVSAVRKSLPGVRVKCISDPKTSDQEPAPRWPRWVPREYLPADYSEQFQATVAAFKARHKRDISDARPVIWWGAGKAISAFYSHRHGYFAIGRTGDWLALPTPRVDWDIPF